MSSLESDANKGPDRALTPNHANTTISIDTRFQHPMQ